MEINNTKHIVTLLVDTGADISVVKNNFFKPQLINNNITTTITGIGQGYLKSIRKIFLEMKFKNFLISRYFQVVQNNFRIPSDGIIGLNFLKKYNCVLDFNE